MDYNLITVVLLLGLAVVGLVVGVANDAVNFMNSAIGSKAAPRKIIVLIAGLGILAGVIFSSGMMEVARKGIFNPEYFYMEELLIIFMAVMLQNILMLDLFNTFGLPTSTTVSVVFGLLGGAIAVAALKVIGAGQSFDTVFMHINTINVIKIISAIFLSIIVAFVFGSLAQYIARFVMTFDYQKNLRRYGSFLGGLSLSFIFYFILVKGSKGASFMTEDTIAWIQSNTLLLILYSFIACTILFQLIIWFTKINILKIIVLIGTFALAMAFSANDLVNFIGAPFAGLKAYQLAMASDTPNTLLMADMAKKFPTNTWILLISGLVMVGTLYLSKKARTVTKTEVNLGRQDEGFERFESYMMSRMIVRFFIHLSDYASALIPKKLRGSISQRFDASKFKPEPDENGEYPAFDLVRASVNLIMAAVIISFATSLKLPLSTTYVTFIVAMATALPDRAWGRESAVYRVSGVLTVIGGWFFTAIIGTFVAMILAAVLFYGGILATVFLLSLSVFLIIRSAITHKNREKEQEQDEKQQNTKDNSIESNLEGIFDEISNYFNNVISIIDMIYNGISGYELKSLHKSKKKAKKINKILNSIITKMLKLTRLATDEQFENSRVYAKNMAALTSIADRLNYIASQNHRYVDNNHEKFTQQQLDELKIIMDNFKEIIKLTIKTFDKKDFTLVKSINTGSQAFSEEIDRITKNQLKRIKKSTANFKRSKLFLESLSDYDAIIEHTITIIKSSKQIHDIIIPAVQPKKNILAQVDPAGKIIDELNIMNRNPEKKN